MAGDPVRDSTHEIQAAAEALVRDILADQKPSDELVRSVAAQVCRAVPGMSRAWTSWEIKP